MTNGSTGHAILYTSKKADITLDESPEAKLCNDGIPPQVFAFSMYQCFSTRGKFVPWEAFGKFLKIFLVVTAKGITAGF